MKQKKQDMGRRQFLKAASAGIGAIAISGITAKGIKASPLPPKWDEEVDVIIIGSGFAGLAAAIEATEAGVKVIVLEKMPIVGGNSRINGGFIAAAGSNKQKEQGINDSPDLLFKDMLKAGQSLNNPELARFLAENSWPTVQWTIDHLGVEYQKLAHLGGHSVARSYHTAESTGWGIVKKQLEKLKQLGVNPRKGQKLESLVQDSTQTVVGVKIVSGYTFGKEKSGKEKFVKANKAVILASGGFCQDLQMRTLHDPRLQDGMGCTNHPGATGEAMREAMKIGANSIHLSWIQCIPLRSPKVKRGFATDALAPLGIWVDPKTGKRFVNELGNRRVRATAEFAVGKYPIGICDTNGANRVLNARGEKYFNKSLSDKVVFEFDSIEALAEHFKIPVTSLKEQIQRFNKFVIAGKDEDFGKHFPKDAKPLQGHKWYGQMLWPAIHHTMGGLQIDTNAKVHDIDGEIIPNLFAAGEITGGIHGGCRLGSNATTDCLLFGRVAGAVAGGKANPYNS